ncbi:MAG: hypothetical protein RI937_1373, partial [Pseudomonadota bacterium]
ASEGQLKVEGPIAKVMAKGPDPAVPNVAADQPRLMQGWAGQGHVQF